MSGNRLLLAAVVPLSLLVPTACSSSEPTPSGAATPTTISTSPSASASSKTGPCSIDVPKEWLSRVENLAADGWQPEPIYHRRSDGATLVLDELATNLTLRVPGSKDTTLVSIPKLAREEGPPATSTQENIGGATLVDGHAVYMYRFGAMMGVPWEVRATPVRGGSSITITASKDITNDASEAQVVPNPVTAGKHATWVQAGPENVLQLYAWQPGDAHAKILKGWHVNAPPTIIDGVPHIPARPVGKLEGTPITLKVDLDTMKVEKVEGGLGDLLARAGVAVVGDGFVAGIVGNEVKVFNMAAPDQPAETLVTGSEDWADSLSTSHGYLAFRLRSGWLTLVDMTTRSRFETQAYLKVIGDTLIYMRDAKVSLLPVKELPRLPACR